MHNNKSTITNAQLTHAKLTNAKFTGQQEDRGRLINL